ncbi:MAG: exopolyphosphatase [Alphaproteobacteria bacterium]|nr:exopolyphosphatase [Alphaproteobacteria bacterium]
MSSTAKIQPETNKKYRLITRSDMDGLVCAVLLKDLDIIDEVTFAHPKDMQDGKIEVSKKDITTNLPYVDGVYMSFDHHASEIERVKDDKSNYIIDATAKSAARMVYDYFGGAERFPNISEEMLTAVDKADSAGFTRDDIIDPQGWELLSFIMDARTGLGRFREFNISNYQLMMNLIDVCLEKQDINEILEMPDVKERVDLFRSHIIKFKEQIERCSTVYSHVIVLDLRKEETIWAGNRFMIYALFPQVSVSIHVLWGKNKQNTVLAVGKSIFNKTSKTKIGELMLEYGGGGHESAGTCQISNLKANEVLDEIVDKINANG